MAGEQLEFEIVSKTAKAASDLANFDASLVKTGNTATREAQAIRDALSSINNIKLRDKLLGNFESELGRARVAAQQTAQSINSNVGGVARSSGLARSALAGFAGGLAALGVQAAVTALKDGAQAFMDFSDTASGIDAKLALATDKFGSLAKAQAQVRDIAASSRSDISAVTDLYSSMALQATALGMSQDQVATATSTVGKALKISGADANASAGAIRQLGQALGSGKLSGDEFNSIAEASPRLMQLFADAVGKPRGELKKLASDGKLTSDILVKGLTDPKLVAGIEREFGKIPVTFADVKTALSNSMVDIAGAISKGMGSGSSLSGFLSSIRNATTSLLPLFQAIGSAIGSIAGLIGSLIKGVVSVWAAFSDGGPGSLTILERLTLAFNLIGEAASVVSQLVSQYFTVIAEVVGSVAGWISSKFGEAFSWLVGASSTSTQTVGQSFIGILRAVKFVALSIPKLFRSAFNAVTGIFSAVGKAINSFFNGNFSAFDGLGGQIKAQMSQVGKDVAAVGDEAVKIAQDQKRNQAALDRLTGRNKPKADPEKPAGPKPPKSATADKKDKKDKKSDAEKAREAAAKKYADAVAKLNAELQDLQVTEEQKALLDAFEAAGLERKIDLTGKQADEIRNLVKQIGDAKKTQAVNKALDDLAESTRELAYSDLQLAQVEARRRAGLNTDLSYSDELTKKLDAQAEAHYRLAKAKADAEAAKDIGKDQTQRQEDADLDARAINDPEGAAAQRAKLEIQRQANAERERIMALEVITEQQRAAGMQGILQSERDILLAKNESIAKQQEANLLAERQAEIAGRLSDFMVNMWENPKQAMRQFFQDLMKRLIEAILKAVILGDKLGGGKGIGGLIGGAVLGALGIGARANGGSVNGGMAYRVNEKGQEVFFPGRSGEVLNARKTQQMLGGGGGVTLAPTYHITLSGNTATDNLTLAKIKSQQGDQNKAIEAQKNKRGWRR